MNEARSAIDRARAAAASTRAHTAYARKPPQGSAGEPVHETENEIEDGMDDNGDDMGECEMQMDEKPHGGWPKRQCSEARAVEQLIEKAQRRLQDEDGIGTQLAAELMHAGVDPLQILRDPANNDGTANGSMEHGGMVDEHGTDGQHDSYSNDGEGNASDMAAAPEAAMVDIDERPADGDRGNMAMQTVEATAGGGTAGDDGNAATGSGPEQKKRKIRRRAQNETSQRQRQDAAPKGADGKEGEGPALLACEM